MNKSRKITGILLACCALLMVAIAGLGVTMAKYVRTAEDKSDSARVAIFGVDFAWPEDSTIFTTEYKDPTDQKTTVEAKTVESVQDDVLAPGTSGSIELTISGESEVSFALNIQITEKYLMNNVVAANGWAIQNADNTGTENYAPIAFNVSTTGSDFNLTHTDGSREYTFTGEFDAGTTLNTKITITWTWAFESDSEDTAVKAEQDRKDTAVADLIGTTSDPSYSIEVSATATQID